MENLNKERQEILDRLESLAHEIDAEKKNGNDPRELRVLNTEQLNLCDKLLGIDNQIKSMKLLDDYINDESCCGICGEEFKYCECHLAEILVSEGD